MSFTPVELRAMRRVGTTVAGKYRIERVLGAGGMATVYEAVHRNGHRVALKMLHEEISIGSETRVRFLREGYVANMVAHEGAVRVVDDDVAEDGSAFLVMELLRGETLRARLSRSEGRLPCREVLALGHQLLDVLDAAHAAGIVHRDIKPENLFLTTDRLLKVLDFGIARIEDDANALATATGTRLGTPGFMPPELALGHMTAIDARTDVWSAGATLFQLLSGQLVHEAQGAAEIVVRAATVPARSLAVVAPDVAAPVVAVVDQALRFAREERWPSARAMQEAIEAAHLELYGAPIDPLKVGAVPEPRQPIQSETPEAPRSPDRATPRGATPRAATPRNATPRRMTPREVTPRAMTPPEVTPPRPRAGPDDVTVVDSRIDPQHVSEDERMGTLASPTRAGATRDGAASSPPGIGAPRWKVGVAGAVIALAGVAAVLGFRGAPAASDPGGTADGATGTVQDTGSLDGAQGAGCTAHRQCIEANGGRPFVCRKDDGACVPLETEECRMIADPEDAANDATVWVGAMWPVSEPDPHHYGPRAGNAVRLAQRDFAETSGGLPPVTPGGPKRPIGLVLCDDRQKPERAADHLVNELRVPAVLGFRTSKEVLDLSTSHFLPKKVLAIVATGSATALRDIPHAPGEPRLVWRATIATDAATGPFAATVADVLEPDVRAQPGALAPGEPVRVAQLRQESLAGQSTVDSRLSAMRWNGKSVAENGDAFRLIARAETFSANDLAAAPAHQRTAEAIAAFKPHIVLDLPPNHALLTAIEDRWPASAKFRPRYLTEGTWMDLGPASFDWKRGSLHRRVFSVDHPAHPSAVRFAARYSEVFSPRVTPATAPGTPYDAFYLFAFAAAALGDQPITGLSLARALSRLMPPGEPVEVGPSGIYPAFLALSAGKNIDLQGVATSLDLDPVTGDTRGDFALFCLVPGSGAEPARQIESGLIWDSHAGKMTGTRRCP